MRKNHNIKMKESHEARTTKYYARALKRFSMVLVWLFVVFLIVMLLVWAVPRIWRFATA